MVPSPGLAPHNEILATRLGMAEGIEHRSLCFTVELSASLFDFDKSSDAVRN